jgi:hypothetical protein
MSTHDGLTETQNTGASHWLHKRMLKLLAADFLSLAADISRLAAKPGAGSSPQHSFWSFCPEAI